MSTAIEFNNISKLYRLGLVSSGTLSSDIQRWWQMNILGKEDPFLKVGSVNDRSKAADSEYVWALKDIDFKVEQGDVVGIIGKNGAGKSTLLKLLSKVTAPTTGTIKAKGRIASLLEVGTGFHPELTGRENIYMNGTILGMTKQEINRKLDEIVAFSGCERYIDTPVKRYSSGMSVRLGFAVAAHLDPEILVVDEVLAVGDAEFQKKAIGKMQDVSSGEGRTVLFVSHNMASVRQLCNISILLENGQLKSMGATEDIVSEYLLTSTTINAVEKKVLVNDTHRIFAANWQRGVKFESFEFQKNPVYASDEDIELLISVQSSASIDDCRINCTIFDKNRNPIGTCSSFEKFNVGVGRNQFLYTICCTRLVAGIYSVSFSIGKGNTTEGETNFDVVSHVISFEIDRLQSKQKQFFTKWYNGWGNIFFETKTQKVQ